MDEHGTGVGLRRLRREELAVALEWARQEGWNPGAGDLDAFWAQDPEGYWGAFEGDDLVGTVSAVAYGDRFGFWGLFIVRPDRRGRGIGSVLARTTVPGLRDRLGPDAAVGLDGVEAQVAYYARLGFGLHHRNVRMELTRRPTVDPDGVRALDPADGLPDAVAALDAAVFGVPRPEFLGRWLQAAGALTVVAGGDGDDAVTAYGVVRPSADGWKVGPLFARDADAAERVLGALLRHVGDDPVVLDVPDLNVEAVALAAAYGGHEVFGCARMYLGPPPATRWRDVYGVTTFELG